MRGIVPDEFDADLARDVGAAFVRVLGLAPGDTVVAGHDMRPSGPELLGAFADGVNALGVDVIDIGLCSTDGLYFASGSLGLPGAMFTASHNPAAYNGIKLCRPGAAPVGTETGLAEISALCADPPADLLTPADPATTPGIQRSQDLLPEYARHLRSLVDLSRGRPLRVVVDAGNGMAGLTVPVVLGDRVLEPLPLEITELYFELDGTFPNHEANPIDPANLVDLQAAVLEHGADLGLAFDGDADRCFVVDEAGALVSPSAITGLIATRELAKSPGEVIIHSLITSDAVPEIVREHGGTPVVTRVGHSFIKARMAETGAIFGGEHSGHFYFRDFWRADSGMLAAMHVLAALGETEPGQTLSGIMSEFTRYAASGELNTSVADQVAAVEAVRAAYDRDGIDFSELDGLTVRGDDWWFNVRASNTEPLLRLNVEAPTDADVARIRDDVLAIIRD